MGGPFRYRIPKSDDQFEEFCLDLLQVHCGLPGLRRYGRRGQRQHAIDLIDEQGSPPIFAAQCKADDPSLAFTARRLRELVEDVLTAPHTLGRYVVMSTGKNSTALQDAIAEINIRHRVSGQFTVEFMGWDFIERILDDHPEVVERQLQYASNSQLQTVNTNLEQIAALLTKDSESIASDSLTREIDQAKDEVDRRDFRLAKQRLGQLRRTKWEQLTDFQKFRVLFCLASVSQAEGSIHETARLYFDAKRYAPENLLAKEHEALGFLLAGQRELALTTADSIRAQHPESWRSAMIRTYAAPPGTSLSDLRSQVSVEDLLHAEVLLALACKALELKAYSEGQELARSACTVSDRPWPYAKLLLAQCISHPVIVGDGVRYADRFGPEDQRKLEEADRLLKEAVSEAEIREESLIGSQALIERAGIAERLQRDDEARPLVEEAYRLAPKELHAITAYASLLQRRGELDRAVRLVEELNLSNDNPVSKRQLAELFLKRRRGDDEERALILLSAVATSAATMPLQFRCEVLCDSLALLHSAQRLEQADELLSAVPPEVLNGLIKRILKSRLDFLKGNESAALESLDGIESLIDESTTIPEVEFLATSLTMLGKYRRALPLWKRSAGTGRSVPLRQTLACAQRLGDNSEALAISAQLRTLGLADANVIQWEADLLQEDDIEAAISLLKDYLVSHPDDAVVRLRLTHLGIEHGRRELIQDSLDALPDPLVISPYLARAVTYSLKVLGRSDEAVHYGYVVLHRHFDDVDAHRAYMLIFSPIGPKVTPKTYDVVTAGTAVEYLEADSKVSKWHIIEDEVDPDPRLNEFSPTHALSVLLCGKKVGDAVDLAPGRMGSRPAVIQQIQDKHLYRHQRCMDEFQLRFPDATELQVVHVRYKPDGVIDVSEIEAEMKQSTEAKLKAVTMYSTHPLPLNYVGDVLRGGVFDAVQFLSADDNSIVRCSPDDPQERQHSLEAIDRANEIVLDLSSIATLFIAKALDVLEAVDHPVIMSQNCSEELDRLCNRFHDGTPRGMGYVGWQDGHLTFTEVSEEMHLDREAHLREFFDGVRRVAKVVPCRELSELDSTVKDPLINVFGRHGAQAMLLARKPGRVLWTDDYVQGICALNEYGVRSIWTELVGVHLQSRGLIEPIKVGSLVASLVGFRYHAVMIVPTIFLACGEIAGWHADERPLKQALQSIREAGPLEAVIALVFGIISETVRAIGASETRKQIAECVVQALGMRGDAHEALSVLRYFLKDADEWTSSIDELVKDRYNDARWT